MSEAQKVHQEAATTFTCASCGARAVFDPETQKLKCPYCGAISPIEQNPFKPVEYDINTAPKEDDDAQWGTKMRVMRCEGCGAEIVLEGDVSGKRCAFCGSPHISENQAKAGIAPGSLIPFHITQKAAVDGFRKWIKGKLFAPGKAKKMAQLGEIMGVYLPHWTYDSNATSHYVGQRGEHYYVEVPVQVQRNGKTVTEMRREQRTRWYPTQGIVENFFDDVLIAGSQRLDEDLLSRVRPYDLKQLVKYQPAFISGFISEKASIGVREGWKKAENVIDDEMRELARQDILRHADEARVDSISTKNENVRYKLTLLPMYLSAFKFKDKTYHVLVNGQNGRVGGQTPVSWVRVLFTVLLVLAIVFGIVYFLESGDMPY